MMHLKRIVAVITAIITTVMSLMGINIAKPVDDFRVTTYIVADRIIEKSALCSEDFDIITNAIIFGCVTFDRNGNVSVNEEVIVPALKNLREVVGDRDVTITLNVLGPSYTTDSTDWNEQMASLAAEHNVAFSSGVLADNLIKVLDQYNFDGIHFDYEYPISEEAWNVFSGFLVELDSKLNEKELGIAVADWDLKISTAAIEAVDYFELMQYDIYDEEGRHAPFDESTVRSFKATLRGIPPEKINLGLPFYARPTDSDAYWYEYKGYYDKLDENNYYTDTDLNKTFWFNTPDIIAQKTQFAVDIGYGGVMIWHYTCDLPSTHPDSLLRAIGTVTA